MPLWNLFSVALALLAVALIYKFRLRILMPLRRFEARNARRRAEEARALFDRYAHYRQTVQFAEEQIEEVAKITVPDERTGEPVSRYLFLGTQFATRTEAEAARFALVIEKEREFRELVRFGIEAEDLVHLLCADPDEVVLLVRHRRIHAETGGLRRIDGHLPGLVIDFHQFAGFPDANPEIAVPVAVHAAWKGV